MKNIFFLYLLFFFHTSLAQNVSFNWAREWGSQSFSTSRCVTCDKKGNVITVGYFNAVVDFDPGPGVTSFTANGNNTDGFISKLDSSGNFLWARQISSSINVADIVWSVKTDSSGNVHAFGMFSGIVDFDPGPGTFTLNGVAGNLFVLKLDANGNFIWAKQFGNNATNNVIYLALDSLGNVYTTGYIAGTGDFDPGPASYNLSSVGSYDAFITKFDANGNFVWAKLLSGIGCSMGREVKISASGNVYACGTFSSGTLDFDPGPDTYTLDYQNGNSFVLKLNASGNFVWAKQFGGITSGANSLDLDGSENIYLTGSFNGIPDFDPGPGTFTMNAAFGSTFLSKLTASSSFIFSKQLGAGSQGLSLKLDKLTNVYITGQFQSTNSDFDPGPGTQTLSSVSADVYISKLDNSGNFVWVKQFSGPGAEAAFSIDVDKNSNVYTTGNFNSVVDFDPGPATYTLDPTVSLFHSFVCKLSPCAAPPAPISSQSLMSTCGAGVKTLSASATNSISWLSSFPSNTSIGSGSVFVTPSLSIGSYTYYAISSNTCSSSNSAAVINIQVNAVPQLSLSSSATAFCKGDAIVLSASGADTFSWTFPGNITGPISATAALSPSVSGNYSVSGSYSSTGCSANKFLSLTVKPCTGILENNKTNFVLNIYPNPTTDFVFVETETEYRLDCYDPLGQLVFSKFIPAGKTELDVSTLPKALYLLKASFADGAMVYKLIKE